MEEKNKHSLKKAIDNLPKYSPEANLWDKLSDNLDQAQADAPLHEAIKLLPTYPAPDAAWNTIEQNLPAVRRKMWPRVLAVAASLLLLIGFVWNNTAEDFGPAIVKVKHQEKQVQETQLVNNVYNLNAALADSAFKTIVRAQKESSDRAKEILAELDELNDSKKRLKSRLSKFDTNKNLEETLNKIEKESAELRAAYLATTI